MPVPSGRVGPSGSPREHGPSTLLPAPGTFASSSCLPAPGPSAHGNQGNRGGGAGGGCAGGCAGVRAGDRAGGRITGGAAGGHGGCEGGAGGREGSSGQLLEELEQQTGEQLRGVTKNQTTTFLFTVLVFPSRHHTPVDTPTPHVHGQPIHRRRPRPHPQPQPQPPPKEVVCHFVVAPGRPCSRPHPQPRPRPSPPTAALARGQPRLGVAAPANDVSVSGASPRPRP